jgi:hypothetical protein
MSASLAKRIMVTKRRARQIADRIVTIELILTKKLWSTKNRLKRARARIKLLETKLRKARRTRRKGKVRR